MSFRDEPKVLHNGNYSAVISFWADPLRSGHMCVWMSDCSFTQHIWNIHWTGYSPVWLLHSWYDMELLPSRHKFCGHTIQPCASLHRVMFISSHIHRAHLCLAVNCHLHFWQNDWDLLHANVVTQGWNWYQTDTLEKKIIPPPQPGLKPKTFWSRVWCSNHWAIPTSPSQIFLLSVLSILIVLRILTTVHPHCFEDSDNCPSSLLWGFWQLSILIALRILTLSILIALRILTTVHPHCFEDSDNCPSSLFWGFWHFMLCGSCNGWLPGTWATAVGREKGLWGGGGWISARNGSGPAYLSELLHVYTLSHTLRSSSDTRMLKIQQYRRKTHGFRTFSCFGPHIWNSLPQDLRHCSTLLFFKAKLKTFLFSQYFHPN